MNAATQLLTDARELLEDPWEPTAGRWPRAVALLARQALETHVDTLLEQHASGLSQASTRVKLLCLRDVLDTATAREISLTWVSLSQACHHHPYDRPPTAGELRHDLTAVQAFIVETGDSPETCRQRPASGQNPCSSGRKPTHETS